MYDWFRRQRTDWSAGLGAPAVPVHAHMGSALDYLRRHELEAYTARGKDRKRLLSNLQDRICDDRNIIVAIQRIVHYGGKAAGPDMIRAQDLAASDWGAVARTVREVLRRGHKKGPTRTATIGRKKRPIQIQSLADRIIDRAAVQILGPVFEVEHQHAFCRKGASVTLSLAALDLAIRAVQPRALIVQDIRNAYGSIPRERLWQNLPQIPPATKDLIKEIVGSSGSSLGIPQGIACGPMLLNQFIARIMRSKSDVLGQWWGNYLDDMVVHAINDPLEVARQLERHLRGNGFLAKWPAESACKSRSEKFGLLGFEAWWDKRLWLAISKDSWSNLELHLSRSAACVDAQQSINGLIDSFLWKVGLAHPTTSWPTIWSRISQLVDSLGYAVPEPTKARATWERGFRHYIRSFRLVWSNTANKSVSAGRSAPSIFSVNSLILGRRRAAPAARCQSFSDSFNAYTDGSYLASIDRGGWAYFLCQGNGDWSGWLRFGYIQRTTSVRMELWAVYRALMATTVGSRLNIFSDSTFVIDGFRELNHRALWRFRPSSRNARGKAYPRLWSRVNEEVNRRIVTCQKVRAHSGNIRNDLCDLAASLAARNRVDGEIYLDRNAFLGVELRTIVEDAFAKVMQQRPWPT